MLKYKKGDNGDMKKQDFLEEFPENKDLEDAKKFLKGGKIAVGLASTLVGMIFGFSGCGMVPTPSNTTSDRPTTGSSSSSIVGEDSSVGDSSSSSDSSSVEEEMPLEQVQNLIDEMSQNNYSYIQTEGDEDIVYQIDDNVMFVRNADEVIGVYYVEENGSTYTLTYDSSDRKWHKQELREGANFSSVIYDRLMSTTWEAYDEGTNTFTGVTTNNQEIDLTIKTNNTYISGAVEGQIYQVGDTEVALPDKSNIVDHTEPVVDDENIYEYVNGERKYNNALLMEILDDWFRNSGYLSNTNFGMDIEFVNVVYVDATADSLKVVYVDEFNGAQHLEFDELLPKYLENDDLQSKNAFIDFLNENSNNDSTGRIFKYYYPTIELEYSTFKCTDEQKEEFDIFTQRFFTRMAEKGIQGDKVDENGNLILGSIKNDFPETRLPGFDQAKVLAGLKCPAGGVSPGLDMGYCRGWYQYYLLEYNGQIEWVRMYVVSNVRAAEDGYLSDEKYNVLHDFKNGYMIFSCERTPIDNEVKNFYENETSTTKSVDFDLSDNREKSKITYVAQEKSKELV